MITAEDFAPATVQQLAQTATQDALDFVKANQVAVVDLGTLERAVQIRRAIGEKKTAIIEKLKKPKSWAFNLHKWFCDLENGALRPLDTLDRFEAGEISAYKARADEARRLREREEAERQRQENETRAAAEAAAYETHGEPEMAESVLAEALDAPPPVVVLADETKQIEGLHFTRRWKWRYAGGPKVIKDTPITVIDQTMAIIPRAYLCVDEKKVGALVRAMKTQTFTIPGIDIYSVDEPIR